LFAKSGWGGNSNPSIGWYVGFVKNVDQTWVFTLNIDIYKDSDIKFRELISRKILQERGIIK
jgi:beta-lactamase class D